MSSNFNFEQVRKFYQDPFLAKINNIAKRLAIQEVQNVTIETDDLVGLGDFDRSKLRFDDRYNFHKLWTTPTVNPLCCFEPDFDKYALDLRFDSFAGRLWDFSGKQNFAKNVADNGSAIIYGEPCATSGIVVPWLGGVKKSLASQIKREEQIYYVIYDAEDNLNQNEEGEEIIRTDLQMTGKTIGFSWIFRLNIKSLTLDGGSSNTLVDHYDDGSNSYRLIIGDDANMKMIIKRGGTIYKLRTNNAPLTLNTDLELGFSYDIAGGNTIKFYINGVEDTSTTTTSESTEAFTFNDTYFLTRSPTTGETPTKSFCDLNYIQVARLYNEKVLTAQQFLNHYTNKISISNIPLGQALVTDGCVLGAGDPSFTSTSFTSTSFTT